MKNLNNHTDKDEQLKHEVNWLKSFGILVVIAFVVIMGGLVLIALLTGNGPF